MALVKLGFGAEVDIATGDELSRGFDALGDLLGKGDPKPIFLPFTSSIVGPGVITLGRPPVGRIWNILAWTLLGADDFTVTANTTAALYVDSDPNGLSLAQCRIPGQAVPTFMTMSDDVLWAHSGGSVCVNVQGNAATDQVISTVMVAEWRECDVVDSHAMR